MAAGKKTGGRKKGTPNKVTATVKDNVIEVFDLIGGVTNMAAWAAENQSQFYNLYAKLLPLQVDGELTVKGLAAELAALNGK